VSYNFVIRVLAMVPLALATIACGSGRVTPDSAETMTARTTTAVASMFPMSVTDSSATKVEFRSAPKRIISLSPGATEVLYAVGAADRIVATDRFSDFPEAARATPKLEYSNPSAEAAVGHTPDLVIMATRQKAQVAQFRALGLTVLYVEEPTTIQGVLDQIIMLGGLTEHAREATTLVGAMRQRIDAVTGKVANVTAGPRVFYEVSPDLYSASPDTFIGSSLALLKAQNIARGAPSAFPQLSAETVIGANPEVIILSDADSAKQSAETVAARPGWSEIAAVKSRRIYAIDPNLANRPGPRVVEALEYLARSLYPERFAGSPPR
jgi:iron complex transport system substrate-binding protein